MNLSPLWVAYFQTKDIPSVHWMNIGAIDALDSEIMVYAKDHDYIVFTHDLDFGTKHFIMLRHF